MTLIPVNQKHPTVPLNELEQSAFCQTEPVATKPLAEEVNNGARWQKIPEEYMDLTPNELRMKIQSNKKVNLSWRHIVPRSIIVSTRIIS